MRYFTSDWHFGHEGILRHEPVTRPFASVDEMNEALIERHNSVVRRSDVVYCLGDVAMGKIAESLPLVSRLNGRKILVPGNHDRVFSGAKEKMRKRFMHEYQRVFDAIALECFDTVLGHEFQAMLCHFPYEGDSHGEDRYATLRPEDRGLPLIHGHVHSAWRINGRQFNVGVDANDFLPVSEDELIQWVRSL